MSDQTKSILIWVLIGLLAGWLASFIVGGGGLIRYVLTGLAGSLVGGFLAQRFGIRLKIGNAFIEQVIIAAVGAIIVVLVARILA
ncbi:GlsB/YeaQ/YmgE family stress response membrane protein [Microbaculum sp. FT89]|uniref:GlsB/YeaQ/YmgE family stress response membrane protein n=1 Tax=Microbaculum sp. FT89 TaxID=3447298 RepID=UPI003F53723B